MDKKEPKIIFENEDVLVLDKPVSLIVHDDGRTKEKTLVDWVLEKYPKMKEVGENWENQGGKKIYRSGIVHRLDKDTSGVIVLAKNQETFLFLKEQFQERKIQKTYRAFVHGNIIESEGVIDKPIGKSKKDFRMWSAQPGARGEKREAITEFRVLKRSEKKDWCYIEVYPKTGRTHQIRVHMKAIHHPVICDSLYAKNRERLLYFKRLALHAFSIELEIPKIGIKKFEAGLPEDFLSV